MKITKLNYNGRNIYENTAISKLNEVIDAINDHKQQLNNHLCRILALEDQDEPDDETPAENVQEDTESRQETGGMGMNFKDTMKIMLANMQTKP